MATAKQNPAVADVIDHLGVDLVLAGRIIDYLNELLELDRPAVAALVENRIPCNVALMGHPTCQVGEQHGGYNVGLLGLLNGLCGIDEDGWGPIAACFDVPEDDQSGGCGEIGFINLKTFRLSEQFKGIGEPSGG